MNWEHIIRVEKSYHEIATYILNNPEETASPQNGSKGQLTKKGRFFYGRTL